MNKNSFFSNIPEISEGSIFDIVKNFHECEIENKINLSIGMIKDEDGNLTEFECIKKAQKILSESNLNKEYPPMGGLPDFISALQNIFFPKNFLPLKEGRVLLGQSITGGSALKICSEIIFKFLSKDIYISNLTFSPYKQLFNILNIHFYPYYNKELKCLDIDALLEFINQLENGSVINFQLSSHNPTSLDPSKEEWDKLAEVVNKKKHFAFFDVAYLGYANGSFEEDLYPIYKFSSLNIEMLIAYSSAKNFTNYSEDVGGLIAILNNKESVNKLKTHLVVRARSMYSFNSLYGSRIISIIVNNPELRELWIREQLSVFQRINQIRNLFINEVEKEGVNIDIKFLKKQKGIYIFLDLDEINLEQLRNKFGIFLGPNGRVNITGLRPEKIGYIVKALKDII